MSDSSAQTAPLSRAGYDAITAMLHVNSGLRLGPDKAYLLETRLAPVLRQFGFPDLATLADQLARNAVGHHVIVSLNEAMTINETSFFRDGLPFSHLGSSVLPNLHRVRPPGRPLRIWSAASSTGQEAYTTAIVALELGSALRNRPIEIIGTDLSAEVVRRAAEGRYSAFEIGRGLPARLRDAHFTPEPGGGARANARLRSLVQFRRFNLLDDTTPLGRFDVVFCRNVLIYFDPSTRRRVLDRIARQLATDGVVYLGGAESVNGISTRLARDPREPCCRLIEHNGDAAGSIRLRP